jgi:hypothetical protein
MSALHLPLKAAIEAHMLAIETAAAAGNGDAAIFSLLDAFAAIGRDTAQQTWLQHYDAEDRDEQMEEVENELVFQSLKASWSKVYPELPGQIESVLRETFEDEHYRLEDPLGWAEMNDDSAFGPEPLS